MSIACSSTPVKGSSSFSPSAKFAAPRSFYVKLSTGLFTWTIVQNQNEFTFTHPSFPFDNIVILVDPKFWDWSSNAYTLDHVICESYYHRLLTGVKDPAPFHVQLFYSTSRKLPGVLFYNTDGLFIAGTETDLPPPPPSYWVPDL